MLEKEEMFDAHDEDHSGRLSFDEIVQVIETLMDSRTNIREDAADRYGNSLTSSQLLFFKKLDIW